MIVKCMLPLLLLTCLLLRLCALQCEEGALERGRGQDHTSVSERAWQQMG
jgi:hypothetical protein